MTETRIQKHIKIISIKILLKFCFKILKSIDIVHYTNSSTKQKQPVIYIEAKKAFDEQSVTISDEEKKKNNLPNECPCSYVNIASRANMQLSERIKLFSLSFLICKCGQCNLLSGIVMSIQ